MDPTPACVSPTDTVLRAVMSGLIIFAVHSFLYRIILRRLGEKIYFGYLFSVSPMIITVLLITGEQCPDNPLIPWLIGLLVFTVVLIDFRWWGIIARHGMADPFSTQFHFGFVFPVLGALIAIIWLLLSIGRPGLRGATPHSPGGAFA